MKKIIHKASTRGMASHGWLTTYHSFSFANYYNPEKIHYGALRVINYDIIEAGTGFGTHPHDNMEIITIPLSGAIQHKDSMGNGAVLSAGEIQVMTAGTGITHSEFNHSKTELLSLLQIWVFPNQKGLKPTYNQTEFDETLFNNVFHCLVSPVEHPISGTLTINQDSWFSLGYLSENFNIEYTLHSENSGVYCFVIEGSISISEETLEKHDAIGLSECEKIHMTANKFSKVLLIEVPMF